MARINKRLFELDTASIINAALTFCNSKVNGSLFINIFPSTMLHPSFTEILEILFLTKNITKNIIFEINEVEKINDYQALRKVIALIREHGFGIAFDDVGKEYASIQTLIEFESDFMKLDRYFASNLADCEKKQKFLSLLVDYCRDSTHLILEGIERPEDLAMAKSLGISFGQGYLLGKETEIRNNS